jgi:hypothetical protein
MSSITELIFCLLCVWMWKLKSASVQLAQRKRCVRCNSAILLCDLWFETCTIVLLSRYWCMFFENGIWVGVGSERCAYSCDKPLTIGRNLTKVHNLLYSFIYALYVHSILIMAEMEKPLLYCIVDWRNSFNDKFTSSFHMWSIFHAVVTDWFTEEMSI